MAEELVAGGWAPKSWRPNVWIRYGVTTECFEKVWTAQGGKCAGCLRALAHPLEKSFELALRPEIDHDHKRPKGEIRGVLCRKCNDFLGKVQDNKELLLRLEAYLRRAGSW